MSYRRTNVWVMSPLTIFAPLLNKTNSFHVAMALYSYKSLRKSNMLTTSVTHLTASSLFWASVSKTKHNSKQCCSLPCFFTPLLLSHCLLFCSILITDNWNKLSCISCATFLFLSYCDITCDLLLNRCTATWNLFFE